MDHQQIEQNVINEINLLREIQPFSQKILDDGVKEGDYVAINNCFVLRENFKTNKNNQYLLFKYTKAKAHVDIKDVLVASPNSFNTDISIINDSQFHIVKARSLSEAIIDEINDMGQLIFFLIGELSETEHCVEISNKHIKLLKYSPDYKGSELEDSPLGKVIVTNQLSDPDLTWNSIESKVIIISGIDKNNLYKTYLQSFLKLTDDIRMKLTMPTNSESPAKNSFISKLHTSIREQREEYDKALGPHGSFKGNEFNIREIMRIAYNFSDDAMNMHKLLVYLADLKGIVLWNTLNSHYDFAESIRNLPLYKDEKKASLIQYVSKIKNARNKSFHQFFTINQTIEADLTGISIPARKLTIFPSYRKKKDSVALDYKDREIVEILRELTRTPEEVVSQDFWVKNLQVMISFENLLKSTENALWLIKQSM